MKRRILSVLMILMLCLGLAVTALAAPASDEVLLQDEAGLLTDGEAARLRQRLEQVSGDYMAQINIVTVSSLEGMDIDEYVELLYDTEAMGYGEDCAGALLLVCMQPREYRILTNGFAAKAIADQTISSGIQADLAEGEYAGAFNEFVDRCAYYLDGHYNGFPFKFGRNLLISLVIGILTGLIVASVLKGQLKSVRKQEKADVYVKPGSMQIAVSNDIFLYRNVTRTKKQSSSSSGSSGSSRNISGGSF